MGWNNKEIKGGDFVAMEPGIHSVSVWSHKFDEVNQKDIVRIQFRRLDGVIHSETFWLGENSLWRLKQLSIACGIGINEVWEIEDILGKEIIIHVTKEEYQGKENTKINKFEPMKKAERREEKSDQPDFITGQDPF